MPIVQEVISRQQAAKMMGISPYTVSQYKTSGAISGPVPGLFYTASVRAYLDRRNSGERRRRKKQVTTVELAQRLDTIEQLLGQIHAQIVGKPVRELAQDEKRGLTRSEEY